MSVLENPVSIFKPPHFEFLRRARLYRPECVLEVGHRNDEDTMTFDVVWRSEGLPWSATRPNTFETPYFASGEGSTFICHRDEAKLRKAVAEGRVLGLNDAASKWVLDLVAETATPELCGVCREKPMSMKRSPAGGVQSGSALHQAGCPVGAGICDRCWREPIDKNRERLAEQEAKGEAWFGFRKGDRVEHSCRPGVLATIMGPNRDIGLVVHYDGDPGPVNALPEYLSKRHVATPTPPVSPAKGEAKLDPYAEHREYLSKKVIFLSGSMEDEDKAVMNATTRHVFAVVGARAFPSRERRRVEVSAPSSWPEDAGDDYELGSA